MIQDYVPRNYGFSFGYDCMYSERPSLRGLSFNVTISEQTNKTTCIKMPEMDDRFFKCHCCDMGQNDTIGKIELNPSFVLSSDNTNYKNDIQ